MSVRSKKSRRKNNIRRKFCLSAARINMRRIILKLGGTRARTVRLVISRKRRHGDLTIAEMLHRPQNKHDASQAVAGTAVWRDVILRSHMVSCRGCNCRSEAITRLSRQRSRVRGTSQGRTSAPLPCGRNKGISTGGFIKPGRGPPTKRR